MTQQDTKKKKGIQRVQVSTLQLDMNPAVFGLRVTYDNGEVVFTGQLYSSTTILRHFERYLSPESRKVIDTPETREMMKQGIGVRDKLDTSHLACMNPRVPTLPPPEVQQRLIDKLNKCPNFPSFFWSKLDDETYSHHRIMSEYIHLMRENDMIDFEKPLVFIDGLPCFLTTEAPEQKEDDQQSDVDFVPVYIKCEGIFEGVRPLEDMDFKYEIGFDYWFEDAQDPDKALKEEMRDMIFSMGASSISHTTEHKGFIEERRSKGLALPATKVGRSWIHKVDVNLSELVQDLQSEEKWKEFMEKNSLLYRNGFLDVKFHSGYYD